MPRRAAVTLAVLVGAAVLAPCAAPAQDWRRITATRAAGGEEELHVDVRYGAGRLRLEPAPPATLYRASLRYDASLFRPLAEYRPGRLRIGLEEGRGLHVRGRPGELQLGLGTGVPLELDLEFGAAQATLELGGLRLRRAEISTGASETTVRFSRPNPERCTSFSLDLGAAAFRAYGLGHANIERLVVEGGLGDVVLDFGGEWRGDLDAEIDMGLGSLTLRVPRGVGVHVVRSGALAAFDPEGLVKRGAGYYSPDWNTARHRATFRIDASLGSIQIRWIEPADAPTPPVP